MDITEELARRTLNQLKIASKGTMKNYGMCCEEKEHE